MMKKTIPTPTVRRVRFFSTMCVPPCDCGTKPIPAIPVSRPECIRISPTRAAERSGRAGHGKPLEIERNPEHRASPDEQDLSRRVAGKRASLEDDRPAAALRIQDHDLRVLEVLEVLAEDHGHEDAPPLRQDLRPEVRMLSAGGIEPVVLLGLIHLIGVLSTLWAAGIRL